MLSLVRIVGVAILFSSLAVAADPSGDKNKGGTAPAPASTAPTPPAASNQPSNNTSTTSNNNGGGTGIAPANLASWLAAIAAQNLGLRIEGKLQTLCTRTTPCVVMNLKDFRTAEYRIRAVQDQLIAIDREIGFITLQASSIKEQCKTTSPPAPAHVSTSATPNAAKIAPPGAAPPGLSAKQLQAMKQLKDFKDMNTVLYTGHFNITQTRAQIMATTAAAGANATPEANAGVPAAPASSATAANVEAARALSNLTVVGAAVNVIVGMYKAAQPTYSFGSATSSGITTDDLTAALQANDNGDGYLIGPPIVEGKTTAIIYDQARQSQTLVTAIENDEKIATCGSVEKDQLNTLAAAAKDTADQTNALSTLVSSQSDNLSVFVQDDALHTFATTDVKNPDNKDLVDITHHLLDLNISSSAAVSSDENHFTGSIDQILQATLIATYRLLSLPNNKLLVAGTDAVYCQTAQKIKPDATPFSGTVRENDGGDMVIHALAPSNTPLCYDRSTAKDFTGTVPVHASAPATSEAAPVQKGL